MGAPLTRKRPIPEIGEIAGTSAKKTAIAKTSDECDNKTENFKFSNYPIMQYIFNDPEKKIQKLMIIVAIFPGVDLDNLRFDVADDGQTGKLTYPWPQLSYSPHQLFKLISEDENFPVGHTKVVEFENTLKSSRVKIDEIPLGTIEIPLIIEVQKNTSTIDRQGVFGTNGQICIAIELTAKAKDSDEKLDDSKITFKKKRP